jgi:probable blue pigment (indigoidine) exporter
VIAPGLLALLSPVVATLLGVIVAGESFTPVQVVGFSVTIAALLGGQFAARPRRLPEAMPVTTSPTERHQLSR